MKIKAIVHVAQKGGFQTKVPALPSRVTEGDSMEEMMANLKDAIEGCVYAHSKTDQILSIPVHRNQDFRMSTLKT